MLGEWQRKGPFCLITVGALTGLFMHVDRGWGDSASRVKPVNSATSEAQPLRVYPGYGERL
ncbi:hypothetical protein SAMN06265784_10852 [Paraburkholderia susongensis]|uniref:Uncharacterized protein n=1 Tax=Paraburkholderia susongensis TaxID=1515439 RepID=A0A1X7LQJ7_9BURK|nr:hypothetical protein SAMN06265784_10852 [Paraburkholderia susongensis]